MWLLFVLSCEAPGVAGQVLCARRLAEGADERARLLLLRLLRISLMLGVFAGAGISQPARRSRFFLDPATAATATRLFGWAALSAPLVCPTVLLEASLLGAGSNSSSCANALGSAPRCASARAHDAWWVALRLITTSRSARSAPAGGRLCRPRRPDLPRELGGADESFAPARSSPPPALLH